MGECGWVGENWWPDVMTSAGGVGWLCQKEKRGVKKGKLVWGEG